MVSGGSKKSPKVGVTRCSLKILPDYLVTILSRNEIRGKFSAECNQNYSVMKNAILISRS